MKIDHAGYIAPNWLSKSAYPKISTPEIKSRHAGLLIQLLFVNMAYLLEMHRPEEDRVKNRRFEVEHKDTNF